jgi:hypothetical protein
LSEASEEHVGSQFAAQASIQVTVKPSAVRISAARSRAAAGSPLTTNSTDFTAETVVEPAAHGAGAPDRTRLTADR